MGRELFDFAFREYSRRWAFKHPTPADLFRTMEDASAVDLDWFWRGWFYSIEACDIAIDSVAHAVYDASAQPRAGGMGGRAAGMKMSIDKPTLNRFEDISKIRNREDKSIIFATDADTSLRDFYWRYARGIEPYDSVTKNSMPSFGAPEVLSDEEKANYSDVHLYEITFTNKGGLVMPIIVEFTYKDGTKETERIGAQIWRKNENKVSRVFMTRKEVASIKLDPMRETADINETNNFWGNVSAEPSKFTLFKQRTLGRGQSFGLNPMQAAQEKKK
jgi:hypothetical protein